MDAHNEHQYSFRSKLIEPKHTRVFLSREVDVIVSTDLLLRILHQTSPSVVDGLRTALVSIETHLIQFKICYTWFFQSVAITRLFFGLPWHRVGAISAFPIIYFRRSWVQFECVGKRFMTPVEIRTTDFTKHFERFPNPIFAVHFHRSWAKPLDVQDAHVDSCCAHFCLDWLQAYYRSLCRVPRKTNKKK